MIIVKPIIKIQYSCFLLLLFLSVFSCKNKTEEKSKESSPKRPNILYIMPDDHTSQAWGFYDLKKF